MKPLPRSVSLSVRFKLLAIVILFLVGLIVCFVSLPSLKHAYLTSYGVSTNGTIQQRYSRETSTRSGRTTYYFLVVRYETPVGSQLVRIQTSKNYYARNFHGESVPLHCLARFPSQCVLDDDQLNQTWQILIFLGFALGLLWFQYYLYRKMRTFAESGTPVKGLITKINQRLRNRYLTVYYEFQGTAYQGTIAAKANRLRADWQPGKMISLLVSDAPSNPHRPSVVMVYPASEFKINP